MKTPTNFIPIIGPLYADDLHLTALRDTLLQKLMSGDLKVGKGKYD